MHRGSLPQKVMLFCRKEVVGGFLFGWSKSQQQMKQQMKGQLTVHIMNVIIFAACNRLNCNTELLCLRAVRP